MLGLVTLFLINFVSVEACLKPDGHALRIQYQIEETKRQLSRAEILFHKGGKIYKVASLRYPQPISNLKDTFLWVSRDKWNGGDLELIFYATDEDEDERVFIPEKAIQVRDFGCPYDVTNYRVSKNSIKSSRGNDEHAWRMLGYDPQHIGYYPFPLYPPLNLSWTYVWDGAGSWTTEISGCAGENMFFIPHAPWKWNRIMAKDIKTGETVWERILTSNVWTSVLSVGDSILFVGTSIGFHPERDTTFYALDPFTGEVKWGKFLKTVEESPIVVDTIVYVPSLSKTFAFTYKGDSLWTHHSAFAPPAYYNGTIYHSGPDSVLNARDAISGDLLWEFDAPGEIIWPSIYDNKVFFFSRSNLFGVNVVSGKPIVQITGFYAPLICQIHCYGGQIWILYAEYGRGDTIFTRIQSFDSKTGDLVHDFYLSPKDTNGGRGPAPIFTSNGLAWAANADYIFLFNATGEPNLATILLPEAKAQWPSHGFPIAYMRYYIFAHEDFVATYEADTAPPPPVDTTYNFSFYPFYTSGRPQFFLSLSEGDDVSLKFFDILGRSRGLIYQGFLSKGKHSLDFNPRELSSGVYFAFLITGSHKETTKFLYLSNKKRE